MTALLEVKDLRIEGQQPDGTWMPIVKGVSVEVERGEIGANIIASPPSWADIQARQTETYAMVFGFNNDSFDN